MSDGDLFDLMLLELGQTLAPEADSFARIVTFLHELQLVTLPFVDVLEALEKNLISNDAVVQARGYSLTLQDLRNLREITRMIWGILILVQELEGGFTER